MENRCLRVDVAVVVWFLALSVAASASFASDRWNTEKGNCDAIFASAETAPLPVVRECVGKWLAYVDPNLIQPAQKPSLKAAFQHLYNRSVNRNDDAGQYLAMEAAGRIGTPLELRIQRANPTPVTPAGTRSGTTSEPGAASAAERQPFVPPQVSSRNRRRAGALVRQGVSAYRRGQRGRAMAKYEAALELDPGNLDGLFNLACEQAHREQGAEAVENLQKLVDIGSEEALKRVAGARVDEDFEPIRDYVPYKRVTGYARIKVVNSIGVYGEDEVERITTTLGRLKHKVADTAPDRQQGREAPVIFFKPHSAPTAYLVKQVVVHPGTVMTAITWETPYDIIIAWGNRVVTRDGVEQPATDFTDVSPAEAEAQMDDLLRAEDRILREPEQAARQVDHTLRTPERVEQRVDDSVERVERTVDTIQRTGDTLEGLFK